MAAIAQGRYLLLLNNDAELFPDALQTLADEALDLGEPAVLGLPQYDHATGALEDRGRLCDPFLVPIHNLDPQVREVAMVAGACLWIPSALWATLGGFPEWFEMLAEDMYLCCRARLDGCPVRVAAKSGFRHRIGATIGGGAARGALTTTLRRRSLSERNRCYVMLLCYPAPWHVLVFGAHVLLLLAEGVLVTLRLGRWDAFSGIYWFALRSTWQERQRLGAERRLAQSCRKVSSRVFFSAFRPTFYKVSLLFRFGWPNLR
jgi:GT2 family glycosyltransferase